MKFQLLLPLLMVLFCLSSCKKESEQVAEDDTQEYMAMSVGKYKIYQLDTIYFNQNNPGSLTDTFSYYVKETYISQEEDLTGPYFKVERLQKQNLSDDWSNPMILREQIEGSEGLRTENNRKFVKLVFPVKAFKQWTFGAYIDEYIQDTIQGGRIEVYKNWSPYIHSLEENYVVGGLTFDNVVKVVYAESENNLELREATEFYAKGVGLVQKQWRIFDTQQISSTDPWHVKAENGFIINQVIIEHN